jgi:hypothetical protein
MNARCGQNLDGNGLVEIEKMADCMGMKVEMGRIVVQIGSQVLKLARDAFCYNAGARQVIIDDFFHPRTPVIELS